MAADTVRDSVASAYEPPRAKGDKKNSNKDKEKIRLNIGIGL